MKTKMKKTPALRISSIEGLESAVRQYVDTRLALLRRKAKQERALAAMQAEHAEANRGDDQQIGELETAIQLFAETRRAELLPDEAKAKSRDLGVAVIGFRTNPPSVGKIVGRDTWEGIAERIADLPWGGRFVKQSVALDKGALLLARGELSPEQLAEAGIRFDQGETFFLEPASALLDAARRESEGGCGE